MAKIELPKKIRAEDYPQDQQAIISKISDPFNDLADSFYGALTKSLDFANMNRDLVQVSINVDGTGAVSNQPQVRYNLRTGSPRGVTCVRAFNSTNPNVFPTGAPFVNWTVATTNTIQILSVTNLPINSQFTLTLEIIG